MTKRLRAALASFGQGASLAVGLLLLVWLPYRELGLLFASLPMLGLAVWLGFRGRPVLILDEIEPVPDTMVCIPAGQFAMGSDPSDPQGFDDERPQRAVSVRAFLLWKTPLTRGEYRAVMSAELVPKEWEAAGDDRLPANSVDLLTALRVCNALSAKEGLSPYYALDGEHIRVLGGPGYRLPSEAEWEYACRAGTTTQYWSGDDEADLAKVGWYAGNSDLREHAVAEKPASPLGLHDMHGNVWEWCEDERHSTYEGAPSDGRSWISEPSPASADRVLRGGSYASPAGLARSACRDVDWFVWRDAFVGLRPARSVADH